MGRFRRVTSSPRDTLEVGALLGRQLLPGTVVLLFGDYGVGKTEFVRGIVCGYLGDAVIGDVSSPSFALLHVYDEKGKRVCHYDFYRLTDTDLAKEVFCDVEEDDILCIEWPDKNIMPKFRESVRVEIEVLVTNQRVIQIEASFLSDLRE